MKCDLLPEAGKKILLIEAVIPRGDNQRIGPLRIV